MPIYDFNKNAIATDGVSSIKTVSVMGDSYSAFDGWIPEGYIPWYSETNTTNGITDVSLMWWYKLIKDNNLRLVVNSSYSGSTISNMGPNGKVIDFSFIKRAVSDLGAGRITEEKPDLILIMGGLNDLRSPSELGEVKYSDWTEDDLNMKIPSFCYMLDYLKKFNPTAKIVHCVVDTLSAEMKTGMQAACEHYGVYYCPLSSMVGKLVAGHPSEVGQTILKNDIETFLKDNNII